MDAPRPEDEVPVLEEISAIVTEIEGLLGTLREVMARNSGGARE